MSEPLQANPFADILSKLGAIGDGLIKASPALSAFHDLIAPLFANDQAPELQRELRGGVPMGPDVGLQPNAPNIPINSQTPTPRPMGITPAPSPAYSRPVNGSQLGSNPIAGAVANIQSDPIRGNLTGPDRTITGIEVGPGQLLRNGKVIGTVMPNETPGPQAMNVDTTPKPLGTALDRLPAEERRQNLQNLENEMQIKQGPGYPSPSENYPGGPPTTSQTAQAEPFGSRFGVWNQQSPPPTPPVAYTPAQERTFSLDVHAGSNPDVRRDVETDPVLSKLRDDAINFLKARLWQRMAGDVTPLPITPGLNAGPSPLAAPYATGTKVDLTGKVKGIGWEHTQKWLERMRAKQSPATFNRG